MAATKILNSEMINVPFQSPVYSRAHRENYKTLQNHFNELYDRITEVATATPSGTEVTDARDYATVLQQRNQLAGRLWSNEVIDGLAVAEQSVPDMTVQIAAGSASINGTLCYRAASSNTGTITAPTNSRYDVVVLNSDNTISVSTGNDSVNPILPAISVTQRPLAIISLTSTDVTITSSMITACKAQGAISTDNTNTDKWHWYIQDAIDAIDNDSGGTVIVNPGKYYEEIDITGKNYLTIELSQGAKLYRQAPTAEVLLSINTVGNETTGNRIIGGSFFGNSKAGAKELVSIDYTDNFIWLDSVLDDNAISTATYKLFTIDNSDGFHLKSLVYSDSTNSNIATSSGYLEDGHHKGEVVFCGTTGEKASMLKNGWLELSAADARFPRVNNAAAGGTGGSDTKDLEHNHKWYTFTGEDAYSGLDKNSGVDDGASSFDVDGVEQDWPTGGGSLEVDQWTANGSSATQDIKPAYYELIALIHR